MNHTFNTEIAKRYGLEEAILLENIYFWVRKNKANNKNCYNGKHWTYNSVKAFNEMFEYITPSKISRALKNLEKNGLIETGCFNQNSYDHTKWYTVTEKVKPFFEFKDSILQNKKSKEEYEKPNTTEDEIIITDIKPDIKSNINQSEVVAEESAPSPAPIKPTKHKYGEYQKVRLTDQELEKLKSEYGEERSLEAIRFLDEYKEQSGKKYQSDYMAIIRWVFNALEEKKQRERKGKPRMKNDEYNGEDWTKWCIQV